MKDYLGDSVYAEFDGFGIWLTTNNGYLDDPRNKIYLEPQVYFALLRFVEQVRTSPQEPTTPTSRTTSEQPKQEAQV